MHSNAMKFCLLAVAMLSQLMPPAFAAAASADTTPATGASLEEIVVTATRRAERLQDVPVSVIAFSQEKMDV